MRKRYIFIILIIVIAFIGYQYVFQEHRDIKTETASYTVSTLQISDEFSKNVSESEIKYLNKTIEVSGVVSELNQTDLTLDESIFCALKAPIKKNSMKIRSQIKIKGRVIGYDDLLEQIKLDQCSIID